MAAAELYGAAVGACFLDSLATPWLWPPSEPWCHRRILAHGPVWLDGLGSGSSGGGLPAERQLFFSYESAGQTPWAAILENPLSFIKMGSLVRLRRYPELFSWG